MIWLLKNSFKIWGKICGEFLCSIHEILFIFRPLDRIIIGVFPYSNTENFRKAERFIIWLVAVCRTNLCEFLLLRKIKHPKIVFRWYLKDCVEMMEDILFFQSKLWTIFTTLYEEIKVKQQNCSSRTGSRSLYFCFANISYTVCRNILNLPDVSKVIFVRILQKTKILTKSTLLYCGFTH